MPAVANSLLRNFILLCFLFICLTGCRSCWEKKSWKSYIQIDSTYRDRPPDPYKQLIVLIRPGPGSDQEFNKWLDEHSASGDIKISFLCQDCDNQLMLLTGPGIETYIAGKTVGGGSGCGSPKSCGPSGEDGPLIYSINFAVQFNDSVYNDTSAQSPVTPNPPKSPVTVAVFDTGVDSFKLKNYFYRNDSHTDTSCLGFQANNGWNFVAHNNNWADDYPSKHGTKVASFIVDQIKKYAGNNVKILPVKIHDSHGVSDLFSVLCGLAYAANNHAQVINASFGYYAPKPQPGSSNPDSCATLLKEYVRTYLTSKNILLVAAAGNAGPVEDTDTTLHVSSAGLHNLDSVCFYPASLARNHDLPNVIAVTTIDTASESVSPIQNFSPNVVDIGVQADAIVSGFYVFIPPNAPVGMMPTVTGSSFATPIATGTICANYDLISSGISDKEQILSILKSNGIVYRNSSFNNLIRNGIIMRRK